jgi:DNA-binding NtrC family response regulator
MYKILVVDDEPQIAKVLQEFLVKEGFEAITALGGEEAIEIVNSDIKIDLMVLDMKMPKVAGSDVLKEMKKINKKIPVIILTGSIDAEKYLTDLAKLGYTQEDILYKPVDLFALLDMVKNKLHKQSQ